MQQLDYWASELGSKDASPMEVIKQARAESLQVEATSPTDPSLRATRSLIGKMFREFKDATTGGSGKDDNERKEVGPSASEAHKDAGPADSSQPKH